MNKLIRNLPAKGQVSGLNQNASGRWEIKTINRSLLFWLETIGKNGNLPKPRDQASEELIQSIFQNMGGN